VLENNENQVHHPVLKMLGEVQSRYQEKTNA
jgi:hypothetical protein